LPVDFTLLSCPMKGRKPTLLKKFGSWDESAENWLKYPIHSAAKGGIFLTASSDVSYMFRPISGKLNTSFVSGKSAFFLSDHFCPLKTLQTANKIV